MAGACAAASGAAEVAAAPTAAAVAAPKKSLREMSDMVADSTPACEVRLNADATHRDTEDTEGLYSGNSVPLPQCVVSRKLRLPDSMQEGAGSGGEGVGPLMPALEHARLDVAGQPLQPGDVRSRFFVGVPVVAGASAD